MILFISSLNNLAEGQRPGETTDPLYDFLCWLAAWFSSCLFNLPTAFLNYLLGSRSLYFSLVSFKNEHGLEELRNGLREWLLDFLLYLFTFVAYN